MTKERAKPLPYVHNVRGLYIIRWFDRDGVPELKIREQATGHLVTIAGEDVELFVKALQSAAAEGPTV